MIFRHFHLHELETEVHIIFQCPICYEIKVFYCCLFWDLRAPLSIFYRDLDQQCLALFMREVLGHRSQCLQVLFQLEDCLLVIGCLVWLRQQMLGEDPWYFGGQVNEALCLLLTSPPGGPLTSLRPMPTIRAIDGPTLGGSIIVFPPSNTLLSCSCASLRIIYPTSLALVIP